MDIYDVWLNPFVDRFGFGLGPQLTVSETNSLQYFLMLNLCSHKAASWPPAALQ